MSAGEVAEPLSFFCFFGLLGLDWDEDLLPPDLTLGAWKLEVR